jgi:outer membrane receptor protein involved in Fe transport
MRQIEKKPKSQFCDAKLKFLAVICVAILVLFLLSPGAIRAQVNTADVVGTVTDPSGAVLPNAKVTVTNAGTGISRTVQTSSTGDYVVTNLQVGTYKVKVELAGFKSYANDNIILAVGDRMRVDAKMQLGAASETVSVTSAETAVLESDSSTLHTLISPQAVEDIPLNGRNLINLIQLSAGVVYGDANSFGGGNRATDRRLQSSYSVNGQSDNANNNMVDGMDNNERLYGVIGVRPSMDAVQEMNITTSLYPAETGRTAGGVANVVTKSGTNKFHGSAFEYLRNDKLNSQDVFYNPAAPGAHKPAYHQNQFGASIGGPIRKNRTFFFADYEGFRQVVGKTNTAVVPSLETYNAVNGVGNNGIPYAANFTNTFTTPEGAPGPPPAPPAEACPPVQANTSIPCLYDNWNAGDPFTVTPDQFDPIGLEFVQMYPAPNVTGQPYNYSSSIGKFVQNTNTIDGRVDHKISDKDSIFGRYTFNDTTTTTPGAFPAVEFNGKKVEPIGSPATGTDGTSFQRTQQLGVDYTHAFASNKLLELKASWVRYANHSYGLNTGSAGTDMGFPCDLAAGNCLNIPGTSAEAGLPQIINIPPLYTTMGDNNVLPIQEINNTFQYMASYLWTHQNHSFKFGASLMRRQVWYNQSSNARGTEGFMGMFTGDIIADMLTGQVGGGGRSIELVNQHLQSREIAGYAQDDWRIKPWLTLNLGVRYDIFTPYTDVDGFLSNFNFDGTNAMMISPTLLGEQHSGATAGVKTDFGDFQPRVGFSASLGHDMVLRGGFGMTYYSMAATSNTLGNQAPFAYTIQCGAFFGNLCPPAFSNVYNAWVVSAGMPYDPNLSEIIAGTTTANDIPGNRPGRTYFGGTKTQGIALNSPSLYMEQFSLQLQKAFGANLVNLAYVGNLGRRLTVSPNINQSTLGCAQPAHGPPGTPSPCWIGDGTPENPTGNVAWGLTSSENPLGVVPFAQINVALPIGTSNYNSMQAQFQRRLASGLTANINYTWAHSIGDANTPGETGFYSMTGSCVRKGCEVYNEKDPGTPLIADGIKYDWGDGYGDVRQSFSVMATYELPFGKTLTGVSKALVHGWGVNGTGIYALGVPFEIQNANLVSGIMGINGGDRPNQVGDPWKAGPVAGNPNCEAPSKIGTLEAWFNPCAFAPQPAGLLGNMGANSLHGPPSRHIDASLTKSIPIHEDMKAQFRAEVFNLTNTPSYAYPGAMSSPGNTMSNDSLHPEAAPAPLGSITQRAAGYTPRVFQFALKFLF